MDRKKKENKNPSAHTLAPPVKPNHTNHLHAKGATYPQRREGLNRKKRELEKLK
jgi:hypothetical protein